MRDDTRRQRTPVATVLPWACLLVGLAALAMPDRADAQAASSACVQGVATLDAGQDRAASLLETLWTAITSAWESGKSHDKRVVREFRNVLLDTVGAKQALSKRLKAFEASPSPASWQDVQKALSAALEQLEGVQLRLQDSVRGTALADTDVFSSLKLAVQAKQEIGRCNFGIAQPTSPQELEAVAASHKELDGKIGELEALDKKIGEFLRDRD